MPEIFVFVYGTLMKGGYNHYLLELYDSKLISEATTTEKFTMISMGSFPALLSNGETTIHGEVYSIDERTLSMLDELETPYGYQRRSTWVRAKDTGTLLNVLCYVSTERLAQLLQRNITLGLLSVVENGRWTHVKTQEQAKEIQA